MKRKLFLAALLVGSAVLVWWFRWPSAVVHPPCAEHLRVNPCKVLLQKGTETDGIVHREAGQLHCSPACEAVEAYNEYNGWCWRQLASGECRFEMNIGMTYTPPPPAEHACLRDAAPELRCTFPVDDRPGRFRSDGVCRPVCQDLAERECWTEHSVSDTNPPINCAYLAQK